MSVENNTLKSAQMEGVEIYNALNALFDDLKQNYLYLHFQPKNAIPFDVIGDYSFPAVGPNEQVVVTFQVPGNVIGTLKWVGIDSDQPNIFDNSTWNLRINGNAVPNWGGIDVQKGSILLPTPETIFLQANDVVSMGCVLLGNTGINFNVKAFARLKGWFWY